MKKALAWLLVIAMTAALAVGGTLAYLTDTDEDVNVMTVGQVKIDQLEYERVEVESKDENAAVQEFHDNKPLYPAVIDKDFSYETGNFDTGDTYVNWGQIGKDGYTSEIWDPTQINNEVDKMVFVKNKGDYDAYVRTVFGFEANGFSEAEFKELFHLNINDKDYVWTWNGIQDINGTNYFVVTATYQDVLAPGAITPISLAQIALDSKATNDTVAGFGDTYQILVQSQAVQADGFDSPDTALNEAFGTIPNADGEYPFENDNPTKGTDLRTALHYLNADQSSTKITEKVSKVVFGLTEDHAATVAGYDAVLVDVEQDVPVYAYYVPNGSNYDLYFLATSDIYLPKLSGRLMQGMTNLTAVDTANLNTSRAEELNHLFYQCKKLTDVDVSNFDVSKATTLKSMFNNCIVLQEVDVSKWDISNAEDISYMFYWCNALKRVDVSNFNTSNVKDMQFIFKSCYELETLDVSDWDTGNCEYFNSVFSGTSSKKMNLQTPDVADWDMSSAKAINHMFYGNKNLISLDLSKWDVRNVESMSHIFCDCINLKSVNFTGWQTDSLVSMDGVFNDCDSMVSVDLSMFNTSKVREFSQLFESCESLQTIIGLENFDTSSGQDFSEMFSGCAALKELNLSTFVTKQANINYIALSGADNWMFRRFISGCTSLEKLTLGAGVSFDGDGTAVGQNVLAVPAATNVAGWDGNWYDAEGNAYAPADIPEETARTYYAVKPATP